MYVLITYILTHATYFPNYEVLEPRSQKGFLQLSVKPFTAICTELVIIVIMKFCVS